MKGVFAFCFLLFDFGIFRMEEEDGLVGEALEAEGAGGVDGEGDAAGF